MGKRKEKGQAKQRLKEVLPSWKAKKLARAKRTGPRCRVGGWLAFRRLALCFGPGLPGTQPQDRGMCSHHSLCVSKQKRREGGATLIPLRHLREAPLDATWRLHFRRSTEPLTAQRTDMALLSSILATYSFISGSSPVSAGPGLRPGAGARGHPGEKCCAMIAEGLCCAEL